jgi:uncharacterized membrane protein
MSSFVGLLTSVILYLLAIQAEPVTGFLGLVLAALHGFAAIKYWHANKS